MMNTERFAPDPLADDQSAGTHLPVPRAQASPRVVTSDSLLEGATHLAIEHNGTIYFLRKTRFGKLILTK